jgi:uncharacterized protein
MRILIDMGHPAHVHFFKHFIWEMESRGHEIKVIARDKEVTKQLLDAYNIPYVLVGKLQQGKISLFKEWIFRGYNIFKLGKQFKADFYLGILNPATAISATFNGKIGLTFTDTEHATFAKRVTFPFSKNLITPSCYRDPLGSKQICYNGYHELAYLYPRYFVPNPKILDEIGLTEGDPFIIVRFVSWQASHDAGYKGLTMETKRKVVHEFEKYGRVFITSEKPLPKDFEKYRISVSPEKMHDLLYYATLLYGESATMASECAVLGTHAIFCDFAGRGYTDEEEKAYDLVYNFKLDEASQKKSVEQAVKLLQDPDLKKAGQKKQEYLLKDKIDVTAFMVWFVEHYPDSVTLIHDNPDIQKKFI